LIVPLDVAGATLRAVGGKGVNLAQLARAGFAVPGGFVASTAAYRAFVAANSLDELIDDAIHNLPTDDPAALAAASKSIRAGFSAGTLPPDLAAALCDAYAEEGRPPVAVRSSATAEDLPESSFAGQQDTFLNVKGETALLKAVVDCWSSLWTARAIAYRTRNRISHEGIALAVIVQEMVASEASGVLFTANPLNGCRTEYAIEATLGLGEALVSGLVEPDRYLVDTRSGRIVSKHLGAKATIIQGREEGGTVTRSQDAATQQAIPDVVIGDLVKLGQQVVELLGAPQDIEWAWAKGQLFLLQSRPITSLYPLPTGVEPEPLLLLFSFGEVQGVLDPFTPLGQDAVKLFGVSGARLFGYQFEIESLTALYTAGGRLFINFAGLARHPLLRHPFDAFLSYVGKGAHQNLQGLKDDPRLAPTGRLGLGTIRRLIPFLLRVVPKMLGTFLRPHAERSRFQSQTEGYLAAYKAKFAGTATLAERVSLLEEAAGGAFQFVLPRFVACFGPGMAGLNLVRQLAKRSLGEEFDVWSMTRGMPHNVTTEMDLALWQTAVAIKADSASLACFQETEAEALAADFLAGRLPEQAQEAIGRFLHQYGMRGLVEIDLGRPRWREDPQPVMQVLQSYIKIDDERAPDLLFQQGAAASEAALDQLLERVKRTRGGWIKASIIRKASVRMRALLGLRETPKFWAIRMMGIVRDSLLASGRELVAAGTLISPDDLFFLRLVELRALATGVEKDWVSVVHERRQAYQREMGRKQVPRLMLSDGQAFYEGMVSPDQGGGQIVGSPVSAGVVEGVVRVVLDPLAERLEPGEILVCPGTDPSWTPLFLVAGGLVMEVGGMMTHGSVVAREYGIPAVVGVDRATTRLRTGQRVRVDGTNGQVTLL
jgi:pyruvate,water dikinase